ncbi:MAG: methyltransferase, partial [Patescibacteria group bacterium]
PLAYVVGWQPFLGLKIYLDSHPLIPRSETEWWTEQLLRSFVPDSPTSPIAVALRAARPSLTTAPWLAGESPVTFLDLCAGSGAIGCAALARIPNAQVYFGEIDPAHEATILKNIRENNLDTSRADVRIGDLFEPFGDMKFDIIAVNPPYIPADRELPTSVANYEPPGALRAGGDGLDLIRRIASELPRHLNKSGVAWIECDSAHAPACAGRATATALFITQNLSAEIRNDQYDKPRVIVVSYT